MSSADTTEKRNLRSWADDDKPREKLLAKGPRSLSEAELIGILLGSGTRNMTAVDLGRELMAKSGNNLHELAKKSVKELTKTKGIGLAKAITIVAAMELGRRRKEEAHAQLEVIKSSQDVYELMKPYLLDRLQEEFWVILLNRANQVLDKSHISTGGISSTIVDPKVIFAKALEQSASGIILVHNHPSGQLQPSSEDLKITKKLQDGAGLLDFQLLDHVIFANQGYFSFADEGKL